MTNFVVHYNAAGCLPDSDSPTFETIGEARAYVRDEWDAVAVDLDETGNGPGKVVTDLAYSAIGSMGPFTGGVPDPDPDSTYRWSIDLVDPDGLLVERESEEAIRARYRAIKREGAEHARSVRTEVKAGSPTAPDPDAQEGARESVECFECSHVARDHRADIGRCLYSDCTCPAFRHRPYAAASVASPDTEPGVIAYFQIIVKAGSLEMIRAKLREMLVFPGYYQLDEVATKTYRIRAPRDGIANLVLDALRQWYSEGSFDTLASGGFAPGTLLYWAETNAIGETSSTVDAAQDRQLRAAAAYPALRERAAARLQLDHSQDETDDTDEPSAPEDDPNREIWDGLGHHMRFAMGSGYTLSEVKRLADRIATDLDAR